MEAGQEKPKIFDVIFFEDARISSKITDLEFFDNRVAHFPACHPTGRRVMSRPQVRILMGSLESESLSA